MLSENDVVPENFIRGRYIPEEVRNKASKKLKGKTPWNKGLKLK